MVRISSCLLVVVCLIVFFASSSSAQTGATAHDAHAWVQLVGHLPVGERWIVHTEVQPRWNDDLTRKDQLILRGAVGRRLGTRTTIWSGYGYMPRWTGEDTLHEQRAWQQVSVTLPRLGKWTPSLRLRPEQRFLDAWADSSHRVRAMARAVRQIGVGRWAVALSNEYFQTMDRTAGGPARGFDQNRVFAGLMRRLSPASTIEAGYLWQALPPTSAAPRRDHHTAFVWFNYAPPVE